MINDEIRVINVSGNTCTADELSLLKHGLSFVPTSGYNAFDTRIALFQFFRKIKLQLQFYDIVESNSIAPLSPFKAKSSYVPVFKDELIESFEKHVMHDVAVLENKHKTCG